MFDISICDDKIPRIVGEQQQMQRKIDYSQVIEGYNECLRIDSDFVFACIQYANVYAKNGEIERADRNFNQVLRLDKDIAEAYFNRGLTHIFLGNNRQGISDLSKAGELGIVSAYNIIKRFTNTQQ